MARRSRYTPEQIAAAKQRDAAAKAAGDALLTDVDRLAELVSAMLSHAPSPRILGYSVRNQAMLYAQADDRGLVLRDVAGLREWRARGRRVRKGEHGLRIVSFKGNATDESDTDTIGTAAGEAITTRGEQRAQHDQPADHDETDDTSSARFAFTSVFELGQTEPDPNADQPATEPERVDNPAEVLFAALTAQCERRGYQVTRDGEHGTDHTRKVVTIDAAYPPAVAALELTRELAALITTGPATVPAPAPATPTRTDTAAAGTAAPTPASDDTDTDNTDDTDTDEPGEDNPGPGSAPTEPTCPVPPTPTGGATVPAPAAPEPAQQPAAQLDLFAEPAERDEPAARANDQQPAAAVDTLAPGPADLIIRHTFTGGTVLLGTHRGDGTRETLFPLRHGWKWSDNVPTGEPDEYGAWYIRGSRNHPARTYPIQAAAEALRAAGRTVAVDVDNTAPAMEDREAARAEQAEHRADALDAKAARQQARGEARYQAGKDVLDRIPLGQPLLVDHYSYSADRNRRDRAHTNLRAGYAQMQQAERTGGRADTARRHMDYRTNPYTVAERIERLQADRNRVTRLLEGTQYPELVTTGEGRAALRATPATGAHCAELETTAARLDDELRYWRAFRAEQIERGDATAFSRETISVGDQIEYSGFRGTWCDVVRVNPKSVSIVVDVRGFERRTTIRYAQISRHRSGRQ